MKVTVINEPFVPDFCRTQRWAARTRGRVLRPPDWLAYATAVLENSGMDVELYDFPARRWGKEELRCLIREKRPGYAVLDSTTPSIYSDIDCARIVKEEAGSAVIMVGPHASALPEETLKDAAGAVDVVVRGEYDYAVRDVIACLDAGEDLAGVPGIAYRRGEQVVHTGPRPLIEDLDRLPFPAWHQLEVMSYFDGGKLYPYFDLISGRGCPFRCSFCLWPQVMHGRRYRLRSPGNVVDEMENDLRLWPRLRRGEIF
nr:cobalamin-dependent protein [bacterium]